MKLFGNQLRWARSVLRRDPEPETWMLMSDSGNAIAWYDSEGAGREHMDEIVAREPEAKEHIGLLGFDKDGHAIGEVIRP